MFTSEPSLAQRIERMIAETPIVDPHTHLRCDQPAAPDLAALMSYHWVQTELPRRRDARRRPRPRPARRRARPPRRSPTCGGCGTRRWPGACSGSSATSTTSTSRHLTESNYRDLFDKVAATGRDPAWAPAVLRDRCNIRTVVTSLGNRSDDPAKNPDNVLFMLDAHYLFCPGVATDLTPFFAGRTTKAEYYEALAQVLGERPATTERLRRLLFDWLDRTVTGPGPVHEHLPPDRAAVPPARRVARRSSS